VYFVTIRRIYAKSLTKPQDPVLLYTRARGGIYYKVPFSLAHLQA